MDQKIAVLYSNSDKGVVIEWCNTIAIGMLILLTVLIVYSIVNDFFYKKEETFTTWKELSYETPKKLQRLEKYELEPSTFSSNMTEMVRDRFGSRPPLRGDVEQYTGDFSCSEFSNVSSPFHGYNDAAVTGSWLSNSLGGKDTFLLKPQFDSFDGTSSSIPKFNKCSSTDSTMLGRSTNIELPSA